MLADDMGLGKTLQAMCVVRDGRRRGRRWSSARPACSSTGQARARALPPGAAASPSITGRARARRDRRRHADQLRDPAPRREGAGGAQPGTRWCSTRRRRSRTRTARRRARRTRCAARFRLALTGTPVENRLEELWSLMHFANRGLLGGRCDFDERYARPIADGRAGAAAALRAAHPAVRAAAPEAGRRARAAAAHRGRAARRARRRRARRLRRRPRRDAEGRAGAAADGGRQGVHRRRSRRCCGCARRRATRRWCPARRAPTSSKVEALLEALETAVAEGHKALVFSQWTSLLDLIEPRARARRAAVRAPRRQHARSRRGRRRASRPTTARR